MPIAYKYLDFLMIGMFLPVGHSDRGILVLHRDDAHAIPSYALL